MPMKKITKKLYLETADRIMARNAEPLHTEPITFDINKDIYDQPAWSHLLNPASIILPAQPVMSDLAEQWETAYLQWSNAWSGSISDAVYHAEFRKVVDIDAEAGWGNRPDRPAKSINTARMEIQQKMHKLQEAIDKANTLTTELQQLEMAGARAEFEDFKTKSQRYHWSLKSKVESLESQAKRDQEVIDQYDWEQKSKGWNELHEMALHEDWKRRCYPEAFITASA
jgi:hypothetical protein